MNNIISQLFRGQLEPRKFIGVAAIMFAKGVKETKGANLDEIE